MTIRRVRLMFVSVLAAAMLTGFVPAASAQIAPAPVDPAAAAATTAAAPASGGGDLLGSIVNFLGIKSLLGG